MELLDPKVHQALKVCQERMDLWVNLDQEEIQVCQGHLAQLDLRVHQDFKVCKEEKVQQDNLVKQDHQVEAFQMVIFDAFAKEC